MKDRSDETVDPFSEGEGGTIEYILRLDQLVIDRHQANLHSSSGRDEGR